MWATRPGRVRARARDQVLQNSGSRMVVLRLQLCQREIATTKSKKEKLHRAQQYKSAHCTAGRKKGFRGLDLRLRPWTAIIML